MVRKKKVIPFYALLVPVTNTYIAIAPAFFQYASELFYPISEIIPTGYLFTVGNMGGVFLVAVMGWSEDMTLRFSMRIPMLCLSMAMFISVYFMSQVKGSLKRTMHQQSP